MRAGGLPGSTNTAQACFRVNNVEAVWADATVNRCGVPVALVVNSARSAAWIRGLNPPRRQPARTSSASIRCPPSTRPIPTSTATPLITDYTGNGRRIITIPMVDALSATAMTVLGFRQFLLEPNSGATDITTGDVYGRFLGMYIGSVAPVPQGRFDGCSISAGPGKVVLHQ